jgi:two-component system osmolarity sensor histidine kinase EnvZ
MSDDIEEMERMLNEYLEFSRNQKNEDTEIIKINSLIEEVVKKYNTEKIKINFDSNIEIPLRQNTFKRCLNNLIDNSLSYGKKVEISTKKIVKDLIILIDDDGPGIPQEEYEKVMKPFYRIDKSRGQNKSGVGLGLSIANDIVRSHGGSILLEKSPLNGLRVKISLPL